MNNFLEKFGALKWPVKLGVLAGIIALILGGIIFGLYQPKVQELEKKTTALQGKKAELEKMEAIAADYPAFKAEKEKLEQELKTALTKLPDSSQIPELLTSISNEAKRANLDVKNFKRNDEVKKPPIYAEVPVNMSVEGSYHQVARFFESLGKLDRIVNVRKVSMKPAQKQGGGARNLKFDTNETRVAADFLVVTYRFLSNAEAPPPAPTKAAAPPKKSD